MNLIKRTLDRCEVEFLLLGMMVVSPMADSLLTATGWGEILLLSFFVAICLLFIYKVVVSKSPNWAWAAWGSFCCLIVPVALFGYFAGPGQKDSHVKIIYVLCNVLFIATVLLRTCFRLEDLKRVESASSHDSDLKDHQD